MRLFTLMSPIPSRLAAAITAILVGILGFAGSASAVPTIELIWSGTTGAGTTGSSTIDALPGDILTLQIDIVLDVPDGLRDVSLSIEYDSDALTGTSGVDCPFIPPNTGPGVCFVDFRLLLPQQPGVDIFNVGAGSFMNRFDAYSIDPIGPLAGTLHLGEATFVVTESDTVTTFFFVGTDIITDWLGFDLTSQVAAVQAHVVVPPQFDAETIYWADFAEDTIRMVSSDGSGVALLVAGAGAPTDLAVDLTHGHIYWCATATNSIRRSNLDGSGVVTLVSNGLDFPSGIALDLQAGRFYVSSFGSDEILRFDLDGANPTVVASVAGPRGLGVHLAEGNLYYQSETNTRIYRATLDGEREEILTVTGVGPIGLDVDAAGGKVYWTELGAEKVRRMNLDGTGAEDLVSTGTRPRGAGRSGGLRGFGRALGPRCTPHRGRDPGCRPEIR